MRGESQKSGERTGTKTDVIGEGHKVEIGLKKRRKKDREVERGLKKDRYGRRRTEKWREDGKNERYETRGQRSDRKVESGPKERQM